MSNFLRRLATGIKDFVYNATRGRYETASGQVVPTERVIAAVERRQEDGAQLVERLAGEYANGNITARELQDLFAVELRRMHEQGFAAGRGGWDAITIADRGLIEARLRDEYLFLREFTRQIASGELTEAQISARMRQYVQHVKVSYWQGQNEAQKATNKSQMRRVLNPAEHCPDCTGYAAQGWADIGSLPVPGDGSECRSNCACTVEYR